ncbi:MAG: molybdate ABC transporter substrate-binding protein [Rudaea sp.]
MRDEFTRKGAVGSGLVQCVAALISALVLLALASGCGSSGAGGKTITVLAAASLTEAFQEIAAAFEQEHAGVAVRFSFAGSQQLRSQIEQGAQADVFASADAENMQPLATARLLTGQPRVFALNKLEVITPPANPANVRSLKDLARPGVKLVIADSNVPAGRYAVQALDKMSASPEFGPDWKSRVLERVVSRETNVRAVATKVSLGEADAGIVYDTDIRAVAGRVTVIPIPSEFNVVAEYPLARLKSSGQPALADAFVDLILSDRGRAILKAHGFDLP